MAGGRDERAKQCATGAGGVRGVRQGRHRRRPADAVRKHRLVHPGPADVVPFVGRRRGPRDVATFFAALAATQTAERFEPLEFIASGKRVVVLGTQRWHVLSTGRTYEDDWVHVFTIESGKIAKFAEYHDTAAEAAAHRY